MELDSVTSFAGKKLVLSIKLDWYLEQTSVEAVLPDHSIENIFKSNVLELAFLVQDVSIRFWLYNPRL